MPQTRLARTRATVLVVDDSPEMLRYLRFLLEAEAYAVETAQNGEDALSRLSNGWTPDVVLLDLQMPCLDGLGTLRRLLRLRPKLKVIMCSGVDDPRKVRRATRLGAHAYLIKPVRHLYLSAALERCLRSVPRPSASGTASNLLSLPSGKQA